MGNFFGYERISTKEERGKQRFTRQDSAIKNYFKKNNIDYVRIYQDDTSAKDFNRSGWQKLEKALHSGDTIVMKDITRFSRQAEEGYEKYMKLLNSGINIVFIDNPTICTSYIKELLQVADSQKLIAKISLESMIKLLLFVEFDRAEQERLTLIRRTKDGILASGKTQGRKKGQLDKMSESLKETLIKYNADRSIRQVDIMKKYHISRNTVKKYAKIVAEEVEGESR